MKLHFENWKREKRFSKKISSLFDESIICYKHGAYRASLMFSYLALLTFIKENIIKSNKPTAIPQTRWDSILIDLQNDDKWEKRVFEELTNGTNPVFNIKEDLRQQIKFWKDRRNDCAHFKDNDIDSHHTDSFWSFLKSNLSKINIAGGRQNLLNNFRDHFDTSKTPPNTDISPLIAEIEHAVDGSELKDFLTELSNLLDPFGWGEPNSLKVYNKIFELCPDTVTEKLREFILEKQFDIEFITYYPDKISHFEFNEQEIRELWKKRVLSQAYDRFMFDIFTILTRNSLIPVNQLNEAWTTLFEKFDQSRHSFPNKPEILQGLTNPILGDIIFSKAIITDELKSFMWVNSKAEFIAFYIDKFPLKKETVEKVCQMIGRFNYSYWLRDAIIRVLNTNPTKKLEFTQIATQNSITIPTEFQ